MAELYSGVHQLQKRGLMGRRLHNFGITDPVPETISGQTAHFQLVNKHWELVLFETVLYMVDKNGQYFSLATIISGLFIYYLLDAYHNSTTLTCVFH